MKNRKLKIENRKLWPENRDSSCDFFSTRATRILLFSSFIFHFSFFLSGCGGDESSRDDIAPAPPSWVTASRDNVYPQQGIRADTTAADWVYRVRMEWYPNSEPDVLDGGGYIIYRTSERDSASDRQVVVDLRYGVNLVYAPVQVWVDVGDDLPHGSVNVLAPSDSGWTRGYFWEIRAYDNSDNRSDLSEPIYYRMLSNPTNLTVTRQSADLYALSWQFHENPDVPYISYYMIRVYSAYWGTDSVMWSRPFQQFGSEITTYLNSNGTARPFVRDCTYVWQLNVISEQPSSWHAEPRAGAAIYTRFRYQD